MDLFPEEYPQSLIVMPSLLELCIQYHFGLDAVDVIPIAFRYPDGSLEFQGAVVATVQKRIQDAVDAYWENLHVLPHHSYFGAMNYPGFLDAIPAWYTVQFWHANVRQLDDTYWIFVVPQHPSYRLPFPPVDEFEIVIKFVRRLNSQTRNTVVDELRKILTEVRENAIANEGMAKIKNE